MNIVFCTTCKDRTEHLRQTLPRNLDDNPGSKFLVLDYGGDGDLLAYLRDEMARYVESGRLVVYSYRGANRFHMAHAKNMAHRCGMREGADILVTMDADNLAGCGFESYIRQKFTVGRDLSFMCPDFEAVFRLIPTERTRADPTRLGRGFSGRLAIRAADFLKMGGYNEVFDTWRGEDIDLIARLDRVGLARRHIDDCYLNAVPHSTAVRFKEYPHARQYENNAIYTETRKATDTVVNNGVFGCGTVYRNFSDAPIDILPVPTRVFGIGFQRTATTSLHEAFGILGMDSAHWLSGDWALAIWREMHRWGKSHTLERHYALCDNPIPLLYRELDKAYPGSRFVLTVREPGAWVRSVERLWSYEHNPQRWTWDVDRFSHRVHAITYGQSTFDADVFLKRYLRHNAEAKEYFAGRDDFLLLDPGEDDGWDRLCGFLGSPVPDVPFPRAHQSGT